MNDKKSNNPIDETIEKTKEEVKKKIIMTVAPIAAKIIFELVIGIVIAIIALTAIMLPMMYAEKFVGEFVEGMDKLTNFFAYGKFEESKGIFFGELQKQSEEYAKFNYHLDGNEELDIAIIGAAVHSGDIIGMDYAGEGSGRSGFMATVVDDAAENAFYGTATANLGSVTSDGFAGSLVSTKIGFTCVEKDPVEIVGVLWNLVKDAGLNLKLQSVDVLDAFNIFKLLKEFASFSGDLVLNNNNGFEFWFEENKDEFVDGVTAESFRKMFDKDLMRETGNCSGGTVKFPVFYRYNDYEEFNETLENYLESRWFAQSGTAYGDASSSEQKKIMEDWIEMVYENRDAFAYLMDRDPAFISDLVIIGIPGSASYPIAYTKNLEEIVKTSGYGPRIHPVTGLDDFHDGHDLVIKNISSGDTSATKQAPILSIGDGTIKAAGWFGTGGWTVKIDHDTDDDGQTNITSIYRHLYSDPSQDFQIGDSVFGGQQIGSLGNSGTNSTGYHLHFEVRDETGSSKNPTQLLDDLMYSTSNPLNPNGDIIQSGQYSDMQINVINEAIRYDVLDAGVATRNAVVTALEKITYDLGDRIPYESGGLFNELGISKNWGDKGLDNNGLLQWGLYNGGYSEDSLSTLNSSYFNNNKENFGYSGMSENLKYGDIIFNSVNDFAIFMKSEDGVYQVITMDTSSGASLVKNIELSGSEYAYILHMEDFYSDSSNAGEQYDE